MSFSERILLKISGESLMGESNYGLDISTAKFISKEIKKFIKKLSNLSNYWWRKYL